MTRHFTADYIESAVLRDGTPVVLRLVRPEDKQRIREGFEQLSPESRYARFLGPKTALSADELRYLTEIDQETHFALGAVTAQGEGLGIARFIALPELPGTAEAAVAVADHMQGRGLGRLLFQRLCAAAAERGIQRFRCELLGSNYGMKHLLDRISPDRHVEVSQGVILVDMALPNVSPTHPPAGPAPETGMYRLFRAAAENAVEWTEAVRKLWRRD